MSLDRPLYHVTGFAGTGFEFRNQTKYINKVFQEFPVILGNLAVLSRALTLVKSELSSHLTLRVKSIENALAFEKYVRVVLIYIASYRKNDAAALKIFSQQNLWIITLHCCNQFLKTRMKLKVFISNTIYPSDRGFNNNSK